MTVRVSEPAAAKPESQPGGGVAGCRRPDASDGSEPADAASLPRGATSFPGFEAETKQKSGRSSRAEDWFSPGDYLTLTGFGRCQCPSRSHSLIGAELVADVGDRGGREVAAPTRTCGQGKSGKLAASRGRHWPPEPEAKAGLAGNDGAGIGASRSDWRRGQKWCYPAHAWALEPGLLQVLLALTQEHAAFWNHFTTRLRNRLRKVKLQERERPDSTTVGTSPAATVTPRLTASSPWPPCRGRATTSRHAPAPLTLFLFYLSSGLSFPFFAFLCARDTQSRHDSVSPSLPYSICTKSFALVWSHGTGLESPSECASQLLSVLASAARPAPGALLPPTSGGCLGAAVCGRPQPPLAWSASPWHGAPSCSSAVEPLAGAPPHQGFTRSLGLINKYSYSNLSQGLWNPSCLPGGGGRLGLGEVGTGGSGPSTSPRGTPGLWAVLRDMRLRWSPGPLAREMKKPVS
ncbi:uncharacterized protein LOC116599986 [Mustela erminea]|uniref:uncharacterized protein LOC116599986 n=1 Tax=Mustela erminea TaxID=36723 RepID=UPI0013873D20|nr:uncharacterized protein LOC116599986 [Mustela erminea]